MLEFEKEPFEAWPIELDFANRMPSGTTIATMVVSAENEATGENASTDVLDATTASIDGTKVTVGVRDGENTEDYILNFRGTLSPAGKVEGSVRMKVREL